MNEGIDEQDLQKKIDSTIIQDHKYCLDRCTEIIRTKDKQLRRKDIIIIILILALSGAFLFHLWGYFTYSPVKNQIQLTGSDGNNIGINDDKKGE